ncbi:MAG: glycerate kinase [Bacteroidales bacterium]
MKIVIAIDSFKGSVSSIEAAMSVVSGIHDIFPDAQIISIPLADGGEGTIDALINSTSGQIYYTQVHDPLNRIISARFGILGDNNTAVIEMAESSGLTLLKPEEYNPLLTTSYGTGELIRAALDKGCRNFLIGIGGSATNDAGTGMLQALGFRFYDADRKLLNGCGAILSKICFIDEKQADIRLKHCSFSIACDVTNPLYGATGAAYIFAKQKGADDNMIIDLDSGLKHFAQITLKHKRVDLMTIKGSGAAGGLGGAFYAYLNAKMYRGIDLLFDMLNFDQIISDADLIITGEGKMDSQTLFGKAPYGVLQKADLQNIPVIGICGIAADTEELNKAGFKAIFSIIPGVTDTKNALNKEYTKINIRNTVRQIMRIISI